MPGESRNATAEPPATGRASAALAADDGAGGEQSGGP